MARYTKVFEVSDKHDDAPKVGEFAEGKWLGVGTLIAVADDAGNSYQVRGREFWTVLINPRSKIMLDIDRI